MCCHLTGLWTFRNGPLYYKHTQLNVCEKEELPCFLYLIQIFGAKSLKERRNPLFPQTSLDAPRMNTYKYCLLTCLIFVSAISANTMANQENSKSVVQDSNKGKVQSIKTCIRIHTRVICSVMFRSTQELEVKLSKISTDNIDVENIKISNLNTFKPAHLQKNNQHKSIQKSIQQKLREKWTLSKRQSFRRIQVPSFSTKSFLKSTMSFFAKKEKSPISRSTNDLPTSTPFLQNKSILLSSISEKMTKATTNSSVCNLCETSMYLLALFFIFFRNLTI